MKFALSIVGLIVAALLIPFLIPGTGKQEGADPDSNLPWQIQVDAQGNSKVFGLQPGISSLGEAKERLGSELDVAIIAAPNEVGALEAFYNQVSLGFVLAKVIVTVDASQDVILAMRDRALKASHMESMTKKITLSPEDMAAADAMPIKAISVIPTINLDEAAVVQRFGQPEERIVVSDKRVHLLYDHKGLDVVVDSDGKELLQYVAPGRFGELREPLLHGTDAAGVGR